MSKILVTGATGMIGSAVVRELLEHDYDVRVLVRSSSKLSNLEGLELEQTEGDVLDRASVRKALEGCDDLIHTAGVAHFLPGATEQMYAVNVEGVRIVLEEALAAGIGRAVMTSSSGALGGSFRSGIADESTVSNAESLGIDYLISKYRGERVGVELAGKGLPLRIVRPSVAVGPGDIYRSSGTTFLGLARRSLPVYVPGGASFADVRDIARGHVLALEKGKAGEIYLLGGHNLEMREMVKIVARVAGVNAPREVPFPIAYAAAGLLELGGRLSGKPVSLSRQLVKASRLNTFVSSEKAKKELGYTLRPFEESLRDTLIFFLKSGRLKANTPELRALALVDS